MPKEVETKELSEHEVEVVAEEKKKSEKVEEKKCFKTRIWNKILLPKGLRSKRKKKVSNNSRLILKQ